jgi:serine/threonine-protein kinase
MRILTFNHVIGSGSMGSVYHAELRLPGGFRRLCAVKIIRATGPDRDHFVSRMRDEARLLGMLQDEQILGVTDLVLVEDHDAVVMEYVEGVDLSQLLQEHRVPPRALAELGAEIAGTLHRAHSARHPTTQEPLNVIHRDIKPANVMVTVRGGVRLLDFGVARAAFASRESKTQGLVLGTLNYFPPEILAGEGPTTAVDIYGLGISLWECATGTNWGPPRVQQSRFERRVDQRLAELEASYKPLLPVLRQILQWDPNLRPDGGAVERALLHAADSSSGPGLRTWARDVVPPLLLSRTQAAQDDPLVGRTIEVMSLESGQTPASTPTREVEPALPLDATTAVKRPPAPKRPPPDPASTWNARGDAPEFPIDATPAPVGRPAPPVRSAPSAPRRARSGTRSKRRPARKPRMHWAVATAVGAVLGVLVLGVLGALVVVMIALMVVLAN